jgi:hypothetical protein
MAVDTQEWLRLIEQEYLKEYITAGGGAVKFVIANQIQLKAVSEALTELAEKNGLAYAIIDAASTKLHMIQDVFFAVARSLNWNNMAQHFVESMFGRQGYEWPRPGEAVPIHEVAERNRIDVTLLRRDFRQWLTAEVMKDTDMTQDFRVAITRLCLRRLEPGETQPGVSAPVLEWLQGDLRRVSALKEVSITSKITRHNGRAMLRSLCRWLRLCGRQGLCVIMDIRQLAKTGAAVGSGLRYSTAAVLDGFEVLRQLIDDSEHFSGLLLVVLADEGLIDEGDRKRSLNAYAALKMRVWPDVRAESRDNPLAPLIQLANQEALGAANGIATP